MRQFYATYRQQAELSTLLRALPWSAHLHILARAKRPEEREFYLRMATQNRWQVREIARQQGWVERPHAGLRGSRQGRMAAKPITVGLDATQRPAWLAFDGFRGHHAQHQSESTANGRSTLADR